MRVLVSDVLRRAQIDVVEAADADATMVCWRQHRPDVVVLDHLMPPNSGLEIARQILAEDPSQVIFLFTGLVDSDVRANSDRLGITLCLSKERVFEIPELVRQHVSPT